MSCVELIFVEGVRLGSKCFWPTEARDRISQHLPPSANSWCAFVYVSRCLSGPGVHPAGPQPRPDRFRASRGPSQPPEEQRGPGPPGTERPPRPLHLGAGGGVGLRLRGHSPQATEGGGDHTSSDPFPAVDAVRSPWHRPGGRKGAGTIARLVVSGTQKYAFTSPQARVCARLVPEGSGPGPSWGRCFGGLGPAAGSRAPSLGGGARVPGSSGGGRPSPWRWAQGSAPHPARPRFEFPAAAVTKRQTWRLKARAFLRWLSVAPGPGQEAVSEDGGRMLLGAALQTGAEEGWRLHSHEQQPPSPASSSSSAPQGLRVLRAPLPAVVRTRPMPRRP